MKLVVRAAKDVKPGVGFSQPMARRKTRFSLPTACSMQAQLR